MRFKFRIRLGAGEFVLDSNSRIAFTSMSSRKPNTVISLVDLGEENTGLLVLEAFQLTVEELDPHEEERLFHEMQNRKAKYLEGL
jgi:hypothetical protein